jgi:glycosyltransferase involved in cell wall biosynthesis
MQVRLSVVIITYNEERNIERCLESVKEVADEVVVVDSFSIDKTEEICKKHGVKFLTHAFEGHIEQKNWAKNQATYNYILSLDADEALDEELKKSILHCKSNWTADAYTMNRLTNYCGKWIRYSGWYPDVKTRLFDRRKGHWGGQNPHDKYIPEKTSRIKHLQGELLHYSYYTLEEHLAQIRKFSTIGAEALYQKGVGSNGMKMIFKPGARFIKSYFIKRGFLDGLAGLRIATYTSYSSFLKYSKLRKLEKSKNRQSGDKPVILHISTAKSWRGGEQQLAYLLEETSRSCENLVICRSKSAMEEFCRRNNIFHVSLSKHGAIDPFFAAKIKKLCSHHAVDICHAHDSHAHTFAVLAASLWGNQTPLIVSRRVDFPVSRSILSRYKYNHPSVAKILCVSKAIANITANSIRDSSKIEVVHSGIDVEKFNSTVSHSIRQELGFSENTLLVGNTSALAPHKDYPTFLSTAQQVKAKDPSIKFLIVGEGPLSKEIESQIRQKALEETVFMLGFRKDIAQLLPQLDIFLISSKTEGLGTSILDAFAAGVPVVATRAGGIPELVQEGETGKLCEVGDAPCLANAIFQLIEDANLKQEITKRAFEAVHRFSKSATASKTMKIYWEFLKGGGNR